MAARGLFPHLVLFVGASVLALRAWTTEDTPAEKHEGVELWQGRAASVSEVSFTTDKTKLALEPSSDDQGRYYVATVERIAKPPEPAPAADAGAPKSPHGAHSPHGAAEPSEPAPPKRFVSVERGEELVEALASLRAKRVLGKVEGERLEEYGFDDEVRGQLTVTVDGQQHSLRFGDKTPGGRDRYVRDPASGVGYVIDGQVANDLTSSETRLVERSFHDFGDESVARVRIQKGEAGRELVVHPTEKDFWSSPESPETKDETASNWMTKVGRLRVTTYVENPDPPPSQDNLVVRLDYMNASGKPLGFLELVRTEPEAPGKRARYLARSEHTRWYATVLGTTAEQIDEDLGSLLSP